MAKYAIIGTFMVVLTIIIHIVGTIVLARLIERRYVDRNGLFPPKKTLWILLGTALALMVLHTTEIILWASAYWLLLSTGELGTFEEAVYFSFITFTTLGYGDITLTEGWRLLSGIEAMNGIMLAGWTTAMLFALVQRIWQSIPHKKPEHDSSSATGVHQ